jgi:hypothetical protein
VISAGGVRGLDCCPIETARLGDLEGHEGPGRRARGDDPEDAAFTTRVIEAILADHVAAA